MLTAFLVVLALWIGYRIGWENAHVTVAKECETQGKFFVKNKIYHLEKIEEFYSETVDNTNEQTQDSKN